MKPFRFAIVIAVAGIAAAIIIGCKNPQATALNTLSSLEQTTTAAYQGYIAGVIKGVVPTNNVPLISHMYNTFQADMIVAIVAVQGNSNSVAPPNIISESAAVVSQIGINGGGK
jgi:hypothetical protein